MSTGFASFVPKLGITEVLPNYPNSTQKNLQNITKEANEPGDDKI